MRNIYALNWSFIISIQYDWTVTVICPAFNVDLNIEKIVQKDCEEASVNYGFDQTKAKHFMAEF